MFSKIIMSFNIDSILVSYACMVVYGAWMFEAESQFPASLQLRVRDQQSLHDFFSWFDRTLGILIRDGIFLFYFDVSGST